MCLGPGYRYLFILTLFRQAPKSADVYATACYSNLVTYALSYVNVLSSIHVLSSVNANTATHRTLHTQHTLLRIPLQVSNPTGGFCRAHHGRRRPTNVAMSPLPEYFTNTPATWFQRAEARFAAARPALSNGQKYFHLLGKLPQNLIPKCTDKNK